MDGYVDPSDLSLPMREALLFVDGYVTPGRTRRRLRGTTTMYALERRRMVEWENTHERVGWKLTDKGRFAVAWLRAQGLPTGK